MHTHQPGPKRGLPIPVRALAAALLACAILAALAGCGGSSKSSSDNGLASKTPLQIAEAAERAAKSAASVHLSGSTIDEKEPISLNMELVAGKGAKGHITVKGAGVDVVALEHAFYLQGSPAFYNKIAGAAAAQLLEGKWLKAPSSGGDFAGLAQLTDLRAVIGQIFAGHGKVTSAGTSTVDGQKVVAVSDASKGGTLYVAATGTPYPVEIISTKATKASIKFDRWNQPVTLAAPANAININQLQSGH